MKLYNANDPNVPMRFYKFRIWVLIPLGILASLTTLTNYIIGLDTTSYNLLSGIVIAVYLCYIILLGCTELGLSEKKHWGYILHQALLIIHILSAVIPCFVNWIIEQSFDIVLNQSSMALGSLIFDILIFIYFYKRKNLFGTPTPGSQPEPQQSADTDYIPCHVLTKEGNIENAIINRNNIKFDYNKYLHNGELYLHERIINGKYTKTAVRKAEFDALTKDIPAETPQPEKEQMPLPENTLPNNNMIKCPKCGADIPDTYDYCPYCKKSLKKVRRKKSKISILLGILCVLLLLASSVLGYGYYDMLNKYNQANTALQDKDAELKSTVEKANSYINQVNETNRQLNENISELEDQANSNTMVEYTPTYENNYYGTSGYQEEETCLFPGCNNSPTSDSYYCSQHKCLKVGCIERIANTLTHYCKDHKCQYPGCNSGQALNSYYCLRHK